MFQVDDAGSTPQIQYRVPVDKMLTPDCLFLQSAFQTYAANLYKPGPDDDMDLLLPLKTDRVRSTAYMHALLTRGMCLPLGLLSSLCIHSLCAASLAVRSQHDTACRSFTPRAFRGTTSGCQGPASQDSWCSATAYAFHSQP